MILDFEKNAIVGRPARPHHQRGGEPAQDQEGVSGLFDGLDRLPEHVGEGRVGGRLPPPHPQDVTLWDI